ncbi:MAG: M13 family metallopeptidase [Xanthomonadales bacterium]|nr:M13 family metallopeptidase [Xanthomonadales bacterium]
MNASFRPLALAIALTLPLAAAAGSNERGIDKSNFDASTAACADFYQHANGNWLKHNPIPAEYSAWGVMNEIAERNLGVLRQIRDAAAAAKAEPGSTQQKIGDFYASAMDEAGIEQAGIEPIRAELDQIAALDDRAALVALINRWHAQGMGVLFGFGKEADLKNSAMNIAYATQGGLGLPDRDYYTKDDAESKALRAKYLAHVERMLTLVGSKPEQAQRDAAAVLELETRLAKASLTLVDLRDPNKSYNIVAVDAANAATPHYDWNSLFEAIGRKDLRSFSLSHPLFFAEMDKALADAPLSTWQAYLRWHLVDTAAQYLSKDFVDADFDFGGRTLRGAKELRPRWKRAIEAVNGNLGEALGELFVAKTFPPEAKAQMLELVGNLQQALKARLKKLDWMGDTTKQEAMAKFDTFTPKIGYPDKWRDYSRLDIKRQHYWHNVRAGVAFEAARQIAQIGQPVDRSEWGMLPQTVNAYYNPLANEIAFPAAILQPPFFDPKADAALNYGTIGGVIGHELMHGFDDQGSQFDAKGNLRMWWTDEDRAKFTARTAKLVEQFDAFVAIDDLHVNGKLTLGENIADLGGLLVAYDAWKIATAEQKPEAIDGLTPEQRFFHGWAQGWRRLHTEQDLKLRLNTDAHAPARFRVLGPYANIEAFATAFDCKAGDKMLAKPEDRVVIW